MDACAIQWRFSLETEETKRELVAAVQRANPCSGYGAGCGCHFIAVLWEEMEGVYDEEVKAEVREWLGGQRVGAVCVGGGCKVGMGWRKWKDNQKQIATAMLQHLLAARSSPRLTHSPADCLCPDCLAHAYPLPNSIKLITSPKHAHTPQPVSEKQIQCQRKQSQQGSKMEQILQSLKQDRLLAERIRERRKRTAEMMWNLYGGVMGLEREKVQQDYGEEKEGRKEKLMGELRMKNGFNLKEIKKHYRKYERRNNQDVDIRNYTKGCPTSSEASTDLSNSQPTPPLVPTSKTTHRNRTIRLPRRNENVNNLPNDLKQLGERIDAFSKEIDDKRATSLRRSILKSVVIDAGEMFNTERRIGKKIPSDNFMTKPRSLRTSRDIITLAAANVKIYLQDSIRRQPLRILL